MKARDLMTAKVITALPEDNIQRLVTLMLDNDVSALPVVDRNGFVKGIVTEGDIVMRVDISPEPIDVGVASMGKLRKMFRILDKKSGTTAGEIMSTELVTVTEETPVEEIARLMVRHRIKNVPVVREGKLVGLVGRKDILRFILTGEVKQ